LKPSMKNVPIKSEYVDEEVDVIIHPFMADNKTMAIVLTDPETNEEISTPTAYVDGIPEGYVAVKDYSENEGMLKALMNAGIVDKPVDEISSGFVMLHICPLKVERSEVTPE
jgi:hypothetical protein